MKVSNLKSAPKEESFSSAQLVMKTPENEPERRGADKESTKSTTICKFFNRENGCKYGEKCRYRHELSSVTHAGNGDPDVKTRPASKEGKFPGNCNNFATQANLTSDSEKSKGATGGSRDQSCDGVITNKKRQIRRPVCRYFQKSGFCRDGDKCRFLHQANVTKGKKSFRDAPTETPHAAKPIKRPENLSDKLSELTDEGVEYLQMVEIEQLKKRFASGDLKVTQEDHGILCMFTIKPTDPDWPYDINEVQLNITFPNSYPKQIFKAEVTDDDGQFPANFTSYINNDIQKHLKEHEEAQKLRDSPDLLFRPFLRWLDRNLENLFTKALKQIKFDVEARSAGLEFITFDNDGSNETGNEELETPKGNEMSNIEDSEDTKLECVKDNSETSVIQIIDSGGDDGDEEKVPEKEETSAMFEMVEARKTGVSKKGTEIRFRGLELHENSATVRVTSLNFTVQCVRCKNREEMPNVKENTQVVLTCSKCSNAQSIVFTSVEVVHQHSSTLAYINPQGCLPVDLILSECQLVLGCLSCNKETSIKGINYGSTKNVWCHHCHSKLDMKVEAARFHQLQPAKQSDDSIKTVELKKTKKSKDPPIKSGQALPDNGTCKHYKKSFRWMRFPCCGKCYPCDKCHEDAEGGHEMEQATRMICGFCSKEQGFSQRGCISCKASMTAVHTTHWEGGKGCRNKIKMNRGDDKKYSDRNKTTSRHAIKVEGQKKK